MIFNFQEFNVLDTQAAEALPLLSELGPQPMLVYLVVGNLFLGALLIVILAMCATQRSNFRRQLRAAKVNAFGKTVLPILSVTALTNWNCFQLLLQLK